MKRLLRVPARAVALGWVLGWLAVVEIGLRVVSLPSLARVVGVALEAEPSTSKAVSPPRLRAGERRRLLALQRVTPRWPFGPGPCLRQSLVAGRILRRHRPTLLLGAMPDGDTLTAHAWLEVVGFGVVGDDSGFLPLLSR
ncbi:MAG: lasso peptide biosynthesis B2 protein [Acidimicrobiales bacterium]